MMSACVKWAKEHLDCFNLVLTRQLSSVEPDSPIWKECIDTAKEHAAMMNDVGLDLKELVRADVSPAGKEKTGVTGLGVS